MFTLQYTFLFCGEFTADCISSLLLYLFACQNNCHDFKGRFIVLGPCLFQRISGSHRNLFRGKFFDNNSLVQLEFCTDFSKGFAAYSLAFKAALDQFRSPAFYGSCAGRLSL